MHLMGDLKQMLPPYLTDPYLTKLHTSRERLVAYVYMYVCIGTKWPNLTDL